MRSLSLPLLSSTRKMSLLRAYSTISKNINRNFLFLSSLGRHFSTKGTVSVNEVVRYGSSRPRTRSSILLFFLVTPLTPTFWSLDAVLPAALQLLPLLRTAATSPCSPCPRISRTATPSGISLEFSPSIPFRSLIVPDSVGPRAASCIAERRIPSTSWPRTSWSPEQMRTRRAPLCIFPSTVQRYALSRLLKRSPLGYR